MCSDRSENIDDTVSKPVSVSVKKRHRKKLEPGLVRLHIGLYMSEENKAKLYKEATKRNWPLSRLVSELVETIANDDLFKAVLQ